MNVLTRDILCACKAESRRKPSGFQEFTLKQAGKRAALLSSDISNAEDLITLPRPGGRPLFVKIMAPQRLKRHQNVYINGS